MKKHQFTIFVLTVVLAATAIIGKAQTCSTAGCLDETFGVGGKVTTWLNSGNGRGWAQAVAVQPADGKIVVAAQKASEGKGIGTNFYVLRYNPDGSIDSTFGIGGTVSFNFSSDTTDQEYPWAVAIQPDGKILVGGYVPATTSFGIARLNTDGSLDISFGTNGKITSNYVRNEPAQVRSILVQPDGYIAVAGTSNSDSFAFARFKPNGSLDTSFNGTGKLVVRVSKSSGGTAIDLKIQPDGKLVAAGAGAASGSSYMFALMRVNTNGTLDTGFGSGGKVFTSFGGAYSLATSLSLDSAGRIVAGGFFVNVSISDEYFAFIRYLSNGQLDATFGSSGKFTASLPGLNRLWGMAIQSDGKIVAGGRHHDPNMPDDFMVMRLNPNAGLDTSYGNNGITLTDFGGSTDTIQSIALQPDGKIVAAGTANGYGAATNIGLARYLP